MLWSKMRIGKGKKREEAGERTERALSGYQKQL